jgi:hypothetical protein
LSSLSDGVEFVNDWWEVAGVSAVFSRGEIGSCIVVHKYYVKTGELDKEADNKRTSRAVMSMDKKWQRELRASP